MLERGAYAKLIRLCCGMAILAILVAGLWPFHAPRNGVRWLGQTNGVRFGSYSTMVSQSPFPPVLGQTGASCSLEILMTPEATTYEGTILAFDSGAAKRLPLEIRQYKSDLAVQTSLVDKQGIRRQPWLKVDGVLHAHTSSLITITGREGVTAIYINGSLAGASQEIPITSKDLTGLMVVGNSTVDDPWHGEISGLAIYHRALTPAQIGRHFQTWSNRGPMLDGEDPPIALYLFGERQGNVARSQVASAPNLIIPVRYSVLHPAFMAPAWDSDFRAAKGWKRWGYWQDVGVNIAGFMPFGFFLAGYLQSVRPVARPAITVIILGLCLSFLIEATQRLLPTRDSSMDDLINNTIGATAGVLLYRSSFVRSLWFRVLTYLGVVAGESSTKEAKQGAAGTDQKGLSLSA
jgi:hypothetical protein